MPAPASEVASLPPPILYMAPMQDVSVLALWRCLERRGGPDRYVTEYFRVHRDSWPEKEIARSIRDLATDKPIIAQMIGREPVHLARTTQLLQDSTPCAGIDLNLGCPAPKVCGKQAGGALLTQHHLIRDMVETLRPIVQGSLTLKTRLGFESADEFDGLMELYASLPIDGLVVHGRTVRERYQSNVHTDAIAEAVRSLPFPVVANGSIVSVATAHAMRRKTQADGLMIGRGGIRNPWLFEQVRRSYRHETPFVPKLRDVGEFIAELVEEIQRDGSFDHERHVVNRVKKFTNYITVGLAEGALNEALRRATTLSEFSQRCNEFLNSDEAFPEVPHEDGRLFCGGMALLADEAFS